MISLCLTGHLAKHLKPFVDSFKFVANCEAYAASLLVLLIDLGNCRFKETRVSCFQRLYCCHAG